MIELTQTHLHPGGNCWQTAAACILDVDPETLPDQHTIEQPGPECSLTFRGPDKAGSYNNALQAYLARHHGLVCLSVHDEQLLSALVPRDDRPHFMCGPTVRTPTNGVNHVVVARRGELLWDPHPSRAGLVHATSWGFLLPESDETKAQRARMGWFRCVCPACVAQPQQAALAI